jgi:predicted ArsR family transcriptional regulator
MMPYTSEGTGYRHTDTSLAAAEAVEPSSATIRERVLALLSDYVGGLTTDEAADKLGIPFWSVRPRFTELRRDWRIEDSGRRRETPRTGKQAIVWRIRW